MRVGIPHLQYLCLPDEPPTFCGGCASQIHLSHRPMSSIHPQQIAIADYDYPLPDERIARYPLPDRSSSKLLSYQTGTITEHTFRDLPELLPEGTVLVRNNSKVIRARLLFHKESGARIEIFCLDPSSPDG